MEAVMATVKALFQVLLFVYCMGLLGKGARFIRDDWREYRENKHKPIPNKDGMDFVYPMHTDERFVYYLWAAFALMLWPLMYLEKDLEN